jgi:hypothetical protein
VTAKIAQRYPFGSYELARDRGSKHAMGGSKQAGRKRCKLEGLQLDAADDHAGDVVVPRGLADEIVEFVHDVFVGGPGAFVLHAREQSD